MLSGPSSKNCCTPISDGEIRHSDKTGEKFFHIVGPEVVGITGFAIAFVTERLAARYLALFLMAQSYAGFIIFYSWIRCMLSFCFLNEKLLLTFRQF